MPALRIAPKVNVGTAVKAARTGGAKARTTAKSVGSGVPAGKKGGCGSGHGGFKPGNVCAKGGRQGLAERIKAARLKAKNGEIDHSELRKTVKQLREHRRGKSGSIDNATAREHHAKLKGHHKDVVEHAEDRTDTHKARKRAAKEYGTKEKLTEKKSTNKVDSRTVFASESDKNRFSEVSKHLFGKEVGPDHVRNLAGAPHDAISRITVHGKEIHVFSRNEQMKSDRVIRRGEDGKLEMENQNFFVEKAHQGNGIGSSVFGNQVEAAAAAGVSRIVTTAAKGHDKNGYITWAKFGYRGPISPTTHLDLAESDLPREIRRSRNVEDLMTTKEGRDWWTKNGSEWKGEFDPSPGSPSRQIWDAYKAKRTESAKSPEVKVHPEAKPTSPKSSPVSAPAPVPIPKQTSSPAPVPTLPKDHHKAPRITTAEHQQASKAELGQVDKAPAAPKQAEAGPEEHGKSRDLQFDAHDKHDAAVSLAGNIIGKKVDATDIASIAGAPDGSRVRLEHVDEDTMSIHIEGDGFVAKRSIVRGSDGKPYLYNDSLMVEKSHQGQGIGTKVFGRQVEQATQHGISHIQTFAERKDTTDPAKQQVGYKVWPKMGYDAPIPNYILKRAGRPEGQEFHNVSDLMKTPEGRDWWDERGDGMEMKFDLTPGSQSQQVWAAYRAKKAK